MKTILCLLVALCLGVGCGDKSEEPDSTWMPKAVGGPIEVRLLPPAHQIAEDYQLWLDSSPGRKLRLYKAVLEGAEKQENLRFHVGPSEGPLGNPIMTSASFKYNDGTNGVYEMNWSQTGKHSQEVISLKVKPRTVWLKLLQKDYRLHSEDPRHPYLMIMGIEGFPSPGTYSATEETSVP